MTAGDPARVCLDDVNDIPAAGAVPSNGQVKVSADRGPKLIDPKGIVLRDQEWLIRHFLPAGSLTIIQGHGGASKGTWAVQQAARVTRGETERGRPGFVLISSTEENFATMLGPKLRAAGTDFDRFLLIKELVFPTDVAWLEEAINAHQAKLTLVDPILGQLDGKVDSYRDHDVKLALRSLTDMAYSTDCAVLGVHHFTKNTDRGAALSGQASGAFSNTPRHVLAMAKLADDDLRVIEVVKSNVGPTGYRRQLRIEQVTLEGLKESTPILVDDGPSEQSIDQVLSARKSRASVPPQKVEQLILTAVSEGAKTRDDLDRLGADELGATPNQVYKHGIEPLRDAKKIRAQRHGFGADGGWQYELMEMGQ